MKSTWRGSLESSDDELFDATFLLFFVSPAALALACSADSALAPLIAPPPTLAASMAASLISSAPPCGRPMLAFAYTSPLTASAATATATTGRRQEAPSECLRGQGMVTVREERTTKEGGRRKGGEARGRCKRRGDSAV